MVLVLKRLCSFFLVFDSSPSLLFSLFLSLSLSVCVCVCVFLFLSLSLFLSDHSVPVALLLTERLTLDMDFGSTLVT